MKAAKGKKVPHSQRNKSKNCSGLLVRNDADQVSLFIYCWQLQVLVLTHMLHFPLACGILVPCCCCCCCCVASVVSDSVLPHRRQPTRLLCPWDSPGKNTGVGCHFLLQSMKVKSESEITQSCLTFHDLMDCSPPGSSIHGVFQARVLEWVAIA